MEDTVAKSFMISISIVLMGMLSFVIWFTVIMGYNIAADFQSSSIEQYSQAGLSMIINAQNCEDVDAANLYKIMDANRNIIKEYRIVLKNGDIITDIRDLLDHPIYRYKINITGDSAIGFLVDVEQIKGGFEDND